MDQTYNSEDILYDCYDEYENSIGIVFAKDCAELLQKNPAVKYVRGMDYCTREIKWYIVTKAGLFPHVPVTWK